MTDRETSLALLERIAKGIDRLVAIAEKRQTARGSATASGSAVASDLDGQHGDPEVRVEPRDWNGESCKGLKYSECPPEFLDVLADMLDYFAEKKAGEGDEKKARYNRLDAARARGWAARMRSGTHQRPTPVASADADFASADTGFASAEMDSEGGW